MRNESRTGYMNIPRIALDVTLVAGSWLLAILASHLIHPALRFGMVTWMPMLYVLSYITTMNGMGFYDLTSYSFADKTLKGSVLSSLTASVVLCLLFPFVTATRGALDTWAFMSIISMSALGLRYILTFPSAARLNASRAVHTLFVGDPEHIRNYMNHLQKTSFRIHPIGFLSSGSSAEDEAPQVSLVEISRYHLAYLGDISKFEEILDQNVVDEVVFVWKRANTGRVDDLLTMCDARGILARVVLDIWHADKANCHMHSIGPLPVIVYHRSHLSMPQQAVKRVVDILFGFVGLLVFGFASLFFVPFIWISGQEFPFILIARTGLNGRPFRQLRYRINRKGFSHRTNNREEMTPIGRFLHRSRLQYLPSFWNVFNGSMSLVGTRGSLTNAKAWKVALKPGLTGLWHIWDFDRLLDEAGLRELDETYAMRWNFWLDVRILIQTPVIAIIHRIVGHIPRGEGY